MASAEPVLLLSDEPDVVDVGVFFGVAVSRERSVTEEFSGGFLGVEKQQQLRPLQQPRSSSTSSESSGGGVQHLVGGGLGGGTQSRCSGGAENGEWQASLGQKGV